MRHPSQTSSPTQSPSNLPHLLGPDRPAQAPCSTIYSLAATTSPSRTAGPRADRPGDQRGTPATRLTAAAGPCLRAAEARPLRRENRATLTPTSCNTHTLLLYCNTLQRRRNTRHQHRHSPSRTDAGWHRTAVPPPAARSASSRDRAAQPGLGGRAWPGRSRPGPLPASGPRGNPERVPPCRLRGPLPDLPPAGYGMTRSAQVGAPTGGTPVFIPRPDAGLSRRSVSYLWPYPLSAATARQEVQPAAFAVHNRNASTRLPTTTTARLPPPPAERQKPNGQAAAATQNSGGSRGRSRRPCGVLTAAYPLRPEFCSAQALPATS